MSRSKEELDGVTLLGATGTRYADTYSPGVLETFKNKHPENEYLVTLNCPEFTSLCPKTGQPDFAKIVFRYIPSQTTATPSIRIWCAPVCSPRWKTISETNNKTLKEWESHTNIPPPTFFSRLRKKSWC